MSLKYMIKSEISPNSWFKRVTGINENEWDYQLESLPKIVGLGQFQTLSCTQLIDLCGQMSTNYLPQFQIISRRQFQDHEYFDTSSLQVNASPRTMFQVASNFNCLEVGSHRTNPFNGSYLTRLMSDSTQGPSAAGGAGFGAILRLAYHRQKPINLLENTSLNPVNGKLDVIEPLQTSIMMLVKVGLHTDVQATFERNGLNRCTWYSGGPLIDQVYVSTAIYPSDINATQELLNSAYVGTYLSAIYRQSPRLVLTLVGGGCFCNPIQLIVNAIAYAHHTLGLYLAQGCQVELPIYDHESPEIIELLQSTIQNAIIIYKN